MRAGLKKWGVLACVMVLAAMTLTACVVGEEQEKEFTAKAKQGDPEAQYQLSLLYFTGNGVDQSDKKGSYWGRRAADQGQREAQSNLAEMYAIGVMVKKNLVEADKWFTLSSDQGFGPAIRRMKELERTMTPEQIAQAKALAAEWKPKMETPPAASVSSAPSVPSASAAVSAQESASK